jgi:two-component system, NarL family, sensor kinase
MKIKIWFLLLLCGIGICHSQQEGNPVEDSLLRVLRNVKDDSLKINLYDQLRRATVYSDPLQSEKYTLQYLKLVEKKRDSFQIAVAHFYLGNAEINKGNSYKAIDFYLKSAYYFEQVNYDPPRLSSVYNGIAAAYENEFKDSLSMVYYTKSYELSKSVDDKRRMGIALVNMGNVMERKKDWKQTISYLEQAIALLREAEATVYISSAHVNLISAYVQSDQLDKAQELIDIELKYNHEEEDLLLYAKLIENQGRLWVKRGNLSKGLGFLREAYTVFSTQGFQKEKINLYPVLIEAHYRHGDYQAATELQFEYGAIKDSLFTFEKNKSLAEALQKYESAKKDKMLLEQQLELDQESRQKELITYGLVVLALFSVGGFVFFQKRIAYQKTIQLQESALQEQKILELTQKHKLTALTSMLAGQEHERQRIAKDLHDSLGGLLSSVKAHFSRLHLQDSLESKPELSTQTGHLIDEACLEVRRISHDMMPHALSVSGLKGALEDLVSRMTSLHYQVELDLRFHEDGLDQVKKNTIYRLVQELLSNVQKHAEATEIFLQLFEHDGQYHLTVEDNGKGFDYTLSIQGEGIGLQSINSRVEFLDGDIIWDSVPGSGTTISIHFPQ